MSQGNTPGDGGGETTDLRLRNVPTSKKQAWEHLKADLGPDMSHYDALMHVLAVYERHPDRITADPSVSCRELARRD